MAKSKVSIGSLPEGSIFEVSLPANPPFKSWKGTAVVVAQKEDRTETLLGSGKYVYLKNNITVSLVVLGDKKKTLDKAKLKKLKTRFLTEGKPLLDYHNGDKVLIWRPALDNYAAYQVKWVGKKAVTVSDEEGKVDVISGRHYAMPIKGIKESELP